MEFLTVKAPNKELELKFRLDDLGGYQKAPTYVVKYDDEILVKQSLLGLKIKDTRDLVSEFTLEDYQISNYNNSWEPIYGEREYIVDHYNSLLISLKEKSKYSRTLKLEFRVFDHGVAFRYEIPDQPNLSEFVIVDELSQFHVPENCFAYAEYGAEGEYEKVLVSEIGNDCERPLTIEYPNGKYLCLTEANQTDYSRTLFRTNKQEPWIIESQLSGLITKYPGYGMARNLQGELATYEVKGKTPFVTPWRVMIVGDKPGDLLEHNYIVLNLANPCVLNDTAWIKPGKAMRDVTISTVGGKATVDFAAKHNFRYILLDAGWYGDPYDENSNAATLPDQVWKQIGKDDHPGSDPWNNRIAKEQGYRLFLYIDTSVEAQIMNFCRNIKNGVAY